MIGLHIFAFLLTAAFWFLVTQVVLNDKTRTLTCGKHERIEHSSGYAFSIRRPGVWPGQHSRFVGKLHCMAAPFLEDVEINLPSLTACPRYSTEASRQAARALIAQSCSPAGILSRLAARGTIVARADGSPLALARRDILASIDVNADGVVSISERLATPPGVTSWVAMQTPRPDGHLEFRSFESFRSDMDDSPIPIVGGNLREEVMVPESNAWLFAYARADDSPNLVVTAKVIDGDCSICLQRLSVSGVRILRCDHFFHGHCLNSWTAASGDRSCPLCRRPAVPITV